jgi:hypothetical protein
MASPEEPKLTLHDRADGILSVHTPPKAEGVLIGHSREARPIHALNFGHGDTRVSLLAGCHADEPVGPRLLHHLTAYLATLPTDDPMLANYRWWIIPHINPDGAERNRSWQRPDAAAYRLGEYLSSVVREKPGDDIEFGFPTDDADSEARPENRAAYAWWRSADGPFSLHVSLHGMAFAAGPWYLIEDAWRDRSQILKERCIARTHELGYVLHDVEREGEKGFFRIERGFCTRPDSRFMRQHFSTLGDDETARLFRPSSMETIRSLDGDPLTLVSEMPLFLTPGVGEELGPPDPVAEGWRARIESWRAELESGTDATEIESEAAALGLRPMPVRDQMVLQWTFIAAGLEQVG